MADTARPKTPKKLFRPSKKVTTPTHVKRLSTSTTASQTQSKETTPEVFHKPTGPAQLKKLPLSGAPKFVRKVSAPAVQSATSKPPFPPFDASDTKSTKSAPWTGGSRVAPGQIAESVTSESTSGAPIGLIDNDIFDPSDTESCGTDTARDPSKDPRSPIIRQKVNAPKSLKPTSIDKVTPGATGGLGKNVYPPDKIPDQASGASHPVNDTSLSKPLYTASTLASGVLAKADDVEADILTSPTEIAKFFADNGYSEMAEFVKALSSQDSQASEPATGIAGNSARDTSESQPDQAHSSTGESASNSISESPRDDVRVIGSDRKAEDVPGDLIQTASGGLTGNGNTTEGVTQKFSTGKAKTRDAESLASGASSTAQAQDSASNMAKNTFDVPKTGKSAVGDSREKLPQVKQSVENFSFRALQASNTNEGAGANGISKGESNNKGGNRRSAYRDINQQRPGYVNRSPSGTAEIGVDNQGKPTKINRSMQFPVSLPERPKPESRRSSYADLSGVPHVDTFRDTDGLANVDDMDDPPEEYLDPEVHSPPSKNISPIPKVRKISPITSEVPPDLPRLANGLAGKTVDDVGNIVDQSGKVLGHATGDLPSMVGKKIAANGEIYGDNGELVGFVTENFTGHPPPSSARPEPNEAKKTPFTSLPGGLKVDAEGNILDSSGNAIGKLNNKPNASTEAGALVPHPNPSSNQAPQTETGQEQEGEGEKSSSKSSDNNGIPADIFLDVKSTPDGIQLTIRIPTVFKQEPRKPEEQADQAEE